MLQHSVNQYKRYLFLITITFSSLDITRAGQMCSSLNIFLSRKKNIVFWFKNVNSLNFDGFIHTDKYNKDGIVHYIY